MALVAAWDSCGNAVFFTRIGVVLEWAAKFGAPKNMGPYAGRTGRTPGRPGLVVGATVVSTVGMSSSPGLVLISVSISFEKFPGKTMFCGVGAMDGLVFKVYGLLDIQVMTKALLLSSLA
jgi:hypothetical protein